MKITQSCLMPQQHLTALLASGLLLFLLPAAAAGLKLHAGPAPAPAAPAPTLPAAPAPAPAVVAAAAPDPGPIRPGIVVQITKNKDKLQREFAGIKTIHYVAAMDEMLGKTYVVKELQYGGAGLASPNGSQDEVWYFPVASLTPWLDTPAAKEVPVAARAYRAVGFPTRTKIELGPPERHAPPWEYNIKGRNLMDPIAPHQDEEVDLEASSMPLPPWRKVRGIASVECMEQLHKDPLHDCDREAFTSYKSLTSVTTTAKPLTQAEAKVLKDKIKHLQTTVDNLTPKQPRKKVKMSFKVPGVKDTNSTMITATEDSNRHPALDVGGTEMKIGANASDDGLTTAQRYSEEST